MVSVRILTFWCFFAILQRHSVKGKDDITYSLLTHNPEDVHLSATDRLVRHVQLVPNLQRSKRGTGDADGGTPSAPALPPGSSAPTSLPKNDDVSSNITNSALTESVSNITPVNFSNPVTQHVSQPVSNEATFSPRTNIPTTVPPSISSQNERNSTLGNLRTHVPATDLVTHNASSQINNTSSSQNVFTTPKLNSEGPNNMTNALTPTVPNLPTVPPTPAVPNVPTTFPTLPSGEMTNFTTTPIPPSSATLFSNDTGNMSTRSEELETIHVTSTPHPIEHTTEIIIITDDHHDYYASSFYVGESASSLYINLPNEESGFTTLRLVSISNSHLGASKINLPFTFPFYGHDISILYIATGGFLYLSPFFHRFLTATQYIAPLMGNFNPGLWDNATVSYAYNATTFVVEWKNVPIDHLEEDGGFTFQTIFTIDGRIIFAYKNVPLSVSSIDGGNGHKVTVGVSDGFYIDTPKANNPNIIVRSIYTYHTVSLDDRGIKDNTAFVLQPLPTCNIAHTCEDCLLAANTTNFDCDWCPELQRCSSGFDRHRQDWLEANCHEVGINDTCPTTMTKSPTTYTNHTTNPPTIVPTKSSSSMATAFTNLTKPVLPTKSSTSPSTPKKLEPTPTSRITTPTPNKDRPLTTPNKEQPLTTPNKDQPATKHNGKQPVTKPNKRPVTKQTVKPKSHDQNEVSRTPKDDGSEGRAQVTQVAETMIARPRHWKTSGSNNTEKTLSFTVIIVLVVIFTIMLLTGIVLWVIYYYRNPGSKRAVQINGIIQGKTKEVDDLEAICETDC